MKIEKVLVQNYKSIVDSGEVDIESRLTVLIGKNEQGKSNFLKALKSFNTDYKYLPNDLPNHLRPSLEVMTKEEVPIVTLWLRFDSDDPKQLEGIIEDHKRIKYLKVGKYYGNNYKYTTINNDNKESVVQFTPPDITQQIEKLKAITNELKNKLEAHAQRQPEFGNNKEKFEQLVENFINANFSDTTQIDNLVKTFCTGIRGVPAQDQPIQNDISATTKALEEILQKINQILLTDGTKYLSKLLPRFIYHSAALDKIPNEVDVMKFISEPEKTSMGMLNLCRATGLSMQKIQELTQIVDASNREVYEDHYKGLISSSLNEFWTQEQYEVHFRIEKDKLSVSISDDTYSPRIPPSERSDGFQWLLSFISTIQNEYVSSFTKVILLDNPALELHVDGQRDIKSFLEEKVTSNAQVIYVTHSPAMVDPFKPEQIRTVELISNNKGTKVSSRIIKNGGHIDILEPLRSAIGSSIGYSLIVDNYNILVEGSADKFLLEGILYKFCSEIKNNFIVNGSLSESKECLLARLYKGIKLPFVAVLDSDSGGREIAKRLRSYGIEENNIIEIGKLFPNMKDEFTLADLVSPEMYRRAVGIAYSKKKIEEPKEHGSKIEKAYEDEFKEKYNIGFCKTRVSQSLKKMLIDNKRIDKVTKDNLSKLASEIYKKLIGIC